MRVEAEPERMRVGLALGGGGVRGAAHLGVLSVLEEAGVRADMVAGTSVGSIVGAAYATGMSSAEMMDLMRPLSFKDVARPTMRSKYSLLDTTPLASFIEKALGVSTFDDLDIPFAAVTADVVTGKRKVITEGDVAHAVMASSAIPGIFPPIAEGDALYVDGGTVDLVPVGVVRSLGAEYVISVDLNSERAEPRRPSNVLDLLMASYELMQVRISGDGRTAEVYLAPDVMEFGVLDFSATDVLYERGRAAALEQIDRIVDNLGL